MELTDENWIEWKGGECPVPPGTKGYLRFRCKPHQMARGKPYNISIYRWDDSGDEHDIVAYCVVAQ